MGAAIPLKLHALKLAARFGISPLRGDPPDLARSMGTLSVGEGALVSWRNLRRGEDDKSIFDLFSPGVETSKTFLSSFPAGKTC